MARFSSKTHRISTFSLSSLIVLANGGRRFADQRGTGRTATPCGSDRSARSKLDLGSASPGGLPDAVSTHLLVPRGGVG